MGVKNSFSHMKNTTLVVLIIAMMASCISPLSPNDSAQNEDAIQGTWKLISGRTITGTDTLFTDYTAKQSMIKIVNKTHFAFLRHDLNKGKDSAIYISGGGRYTVSGEKYTEFLDYCNYREWEGSEFEFFITVSNDTLVQQGFEKVEKEGINRFITETYIRVAGNELSGK